jgi:uncharacterized protein YbbC (DUF1343 family)
MTQPPVVRSGLERVLEEERAVLEGKRIALLCNPTSVDRELRHAADLLAHRGFKLAVLFGPEHGVRGDAQDMIETEGGLDPQTGVPVYSLYGSDAESLAPRPEMLRDIDVLVFDIQGVGTRYYTYIWTLILAMRTCARLGIEVVVLDRPNPLGGLGEDVEGPLVRSGFESFVGLYPVATRHGLTPAEEARYANEEHGIGCRLTIVKMEGWRRSMYFEQTGLPWVLPSPNMPTVDTAFVYPGMCLVEGTELSEGRGSTRPFEISGAPFIDPWQLAPALAALDLPGAAFRPLVFRPTFHKFAGQPCGGVQIHVTDRQTFRSLRTGVAYLHEVRRLWPREFKWRYRTYEFVKDKPAIDLLAGSQTLREQIDHGAPLGEIVDSWRGDEEDFRRRRAQYLLYS